MRAIHYSYYIGALCLKVLICSRDVVGITKAKRFTQDYFGMCALSFPFLSEPLSSDSNHPTLCLLFWFEGSQLHCSMLTPLLSNVS